LVSIIIFPISITLVFFAEEILSIWIGDPVVVRNTHMLLSLLVIGSMLNALMTLPYTLQLAYGWTKLAFYKNIVAVIFLVPLMVWMVQMYQGIGAAWVWIILNLSYLIFEVPIMHRRLLKSEMWKWYSIDFSFPVIVVFIVGYTSYILMPLDLSKYLGFSWVAITYLIGLLLLGLIYPFTRERILRFDN
jgi:O-antigen/teichoic acid export membrane protein